MDVALHRLPVTIVWVRAGITGPDGPSHHGMWDASVLPVVPGLGIASPRDPPRLRELLREAVATDGPTLVRYPKSPAGAVVPAVARVGRADLLRSAAGAEVLLVGVGSLAGTCLEAAGELARQGVACRVIDPAGSAPSTPRSPALAAQCSRACVATFALPPAFLPHASRRQLLAASGLDAGGIATTVLKRLTVLGLR